MDALWTLLSFVFILTGLNAEDFDLETVDFYVVNNAKWAANGGTSPWTNDKAVNYCDQKFGTKLATIDTATKQAQVSSAVLSTGWYWIGLEGAGPDNRQWADGTPFDPATSYQNWRPGDPHNGPNDLCVEYSPVEGSGWNDWPCTSDTPNLICNKIVCRSDNCAAGFKCDSPTGKCVRNCDAFDIDGYLTGCSAVWPPDETALNNEIAARQAADTAEQASRQAADATLQTAVDDEETARVAKDNELQTEIDNLKEAVEGFTTIQSRSAAGAVGMHDDYYTDYNTYNVFGELWASYKDIVIVVLLVVNMVMMSYYCASKCNGFKKNKHKYMECDDIDSEEANLINLNK